MQWPVAKAVLDGEICGGTGSNGIQLVLEARGRRGAVTSFLTFDVLEVDGRDMRERWEDRRKRLEDIGAALGAVTAVIAGPGVGVVAAGPLAAALAGAGGSALTGGLIGALVRLGMPEDRARLDDQTGRHGDGRYPPVRRGRQVH